MKTRCPRLATRAIIVRNGRLLLVNAYPGQGSDLWCAPGGGVEPGRSLTENLMREVHEECGLTVAVGALALVNEFHDPRSGFHQVELFFRCTITGGRPDPDWCDPDWCDPGWCDPGWPDPAGVVNRRRFFGPADLAWIRLKPDSLPRIAFAETGPAHYDPLEVIVP